MYGVVTAKFYWDDVRLDIIDFKVGSKYKDWKNKPIYLVAIYSGSKCGERYLAIHDVLLLTSSLN